jgi:NAD(P)-dependent dehydrogenase (short-subunit alcohol dehydrogenase family)
MTHLDLTGSTALVTGSTQGIGEAIAMGLARAGARVGVNGRTAESVGAAVERVRANVAGAEVVPVAADAASDDGAQRIKEPWTMSKSSSTTSVSSAPGPPWTSATTNGGTTSR